MNKQFVRKMVQAKRLEYQALKEVMPECMVKRMTKLEGELMNFGKEFIMSVLTEDNKDNQAESSGANTKTRKVTIE